MEQASKKWSVTSKGFYVAVSILETLAKLFSIIALITAIFAIEDAFEIMAHERDFDEKWNVMARHALPTMQSAGMTISLSLVVFLVCIFIRNHLLMKKPKK
jgi:hypothetical protein